MKASAFLDADTRASLARLPEIAAQESLEPPPLAEVYVPAGHQRALSLDAGIVVGMRGAGKSLWTAVLSSDRHRQFVAGLSGSVALQRATVRVGFGMDDSNEHFPNAQVLSSLLSQTGAADSLPIWKAVVCRHALRVLKQNHPLLSMDWQAASSWVQSQPEAADRLLTVCDEQLARSETVLLVLFDALDRLADNNWTNVRHLLKGALRLALACRSRRALRLKFFLRPDMEEDSEVWDFTDSSKLRQGKVELSWRTADLYALVVTFLANDLQSGGLFRRVVTELTGTHWQKTEGVFPLPRALIDDSKLRPLIEEIAGPWMGRDRKRGFTYTWIPTHLADAAGRISPRSLLLTFRHASLIMDELYSDHFYPLHYEAIQRGVAESSQIRIEELKEDYPWVRSLLEAARNLSVPCSAEELIERWTPERLRGMRSAARKLPPRRFTTDPSRKGQPEVLIDDLVELAVLYRTEDERLNMPDIFRVAFGIKRKGGVKPLR